MTAAGTRAIELVRRAGIVHRVHAYESPERHGRDRGARPAYGRDAAEALGVEPERIYKTLVATVDERLVLAVVPVDRELDLKRIADACSGRRADLAEPAVAERATGYVIGGISPLGARRPIPVVVDDMSREQATIFVSAGRRGLQLELAPADLVRLTGAIVAPITRDFLVVDTATPALAYSERSQASPPNRQAQPKNAAPHGRFLSSRRAVDSADMDRLTRSTVRSGVPRRQDPDARPSPRTPLLPAAPPTVTAPQRGVPAKRRQENCQFTSVAPSGRLPAGRCA